MPSFSINSYHNFEVPIPESTTGGLVESITAQPLLQNLLQDVSALSSHVNNMQMVQLACIPIAPSGDKYLYLSKCSKHVALEKPFWYTPRPQGSTDKPSESWESLIKRRELKDKYYNLDDGAKDSIKQRLTNAIIKEIKGLSTAQEIWKHLNTKYNKARSAQVFGDIQKVYSFQIRGNQNPKSEIARLALLFTRLKAQGAEMSSFYQAMTLLNAGATKWPHLVSVYLSQHEMKELDFNKIKVMFVANWHRTATLGQPTPKVNKISGVQQKKKDPNWKKGKGKDSNKSESTPPSDTKPSSGQKF
ncbi:hypothetical protein AMATHDRAFT_10242 [Amanita thiersii Skay4041]|uniref:Uncharacterized protein n=1 Tax=Amanita thiersii Skay4041 TaxID=703135 RepID=A0A2A9NB88_9AGAR|nr:hypothetical protein AMATHDRAFT_10242 [Amanita thiersii Skay4041]